MSFRDDSATRYNDDLAARFFQDGRRVSAAITIQRSASDIYDAWAGMECAPRVTDLVQSVVSDGGRMRWSGRADGEPFEWDAEVINEEPGRIFAWRSVGNPAIPNAGSLTLHELPFGRGTEVRVVVEYIPAGGRAGQVFDKAVGRDPQLFLRGVLFRFRQWMETGEVATTRGQPAARKEGRDEGSRDEIRLA